MNKLILFDQTTTYAHFLKFWLLFYLTSNGKEF